MKIAIVKLSALGDIIHAMVVLQFIKKYNSNIKIDWIVEEEYRSVLDCNPDINKIITVNIKKAKNKKSLYLLLKELVKIRKYGQYDLVIDMQGLIKSALVAWTIPSDITIGFDKGSLREGLAAKFYNKTYKLDYSENIIIRNFSLAMHAIDIPRNDENLANKLAFLYPCDEYFFDQKSIDRKNVLLVIGSSVKSKCYPVEKLIELTKAIDANYLVLWGTMEEKLVANKMKNLSNNIHILQKVSIYELIALVSQVDIVIGPDTGPTHMAWALNIPSITIFGPTPGYRNSYQTRINKIIESESQVNPYSINKNDFSINNIPVNDIVKIAQYLLTVKL